jgi:hypothetical protein
VECQPKECEFPYNVTVSTSLTNVRLDPELEAAAGSKAGDIKKRLEEILVLNPPTFTRWCCTVDNCSLTDSIDGGYSDFDGVAQEASTIVSGSGANLDAGISVYTQNYFFNGSHLVSGLQYTPNGTTGLHRVDIYEFYFGPFGNPPESMTLRKICDGKTKYTFSENRYMGQVSIDYTPENGESNRAIGGYYGDATYTVEWDYGGPPNQRKKLIEQENPLP